MDLIKQLDNAVGEKVMLEAGEARLAARVKELTRRGSGDHAAYSALFETGEQSAAAQQMFTITGEMLGEIQLFLVPIGPGEQGMVYEAVINPGPDATP